MNIGSILTTAGAGITILGGAKDLDVAVHSPVGHEGVIIFFYNDNCVHSQNMVQPFIQLAKGSRGNKFYGIDVAGTKDQYQVSKSYAAVTPMFYSFKCGQGFGAFSGENKDSLNQLVSYLTVKIKC